MAMKKTLSLLVAIFAVSAPAFAANVLVNGDFQTGTVGVTDPIGAVSGWTTFKLAANGVDPVAHKGGIIAGAVNDGNNSMDPINATQDLYMSLRGGDTNGSVAGVYQTLTLTPGTYTLDGYLSAYNYLVPTSGGGYCLWQVGIFAGDWTTAPFYGSSGGNAPTYGTGIWGGKYDNTGDTCNTGGAIHLSARGFMSGSNVINVSATGQYTVYVMMGVNCDPQNTDKRRFKLRVDDLVLDQQVVPEPGSMLALFTGLAGLGGMVIRRRR